MKNMIKILMLLATVFPYVVSASLHDRGNGLIYDDVLDITWVNDIRLAYTLGYNPSSNDFGFGANNGDDYLSHDEALAFIGALNTHSFDGGTNLGYQSFTGWRLPLLVNFSKAELINSPFTSQNAAGVRNRGPGIIDTRQELSHLYNVSLGAGLPGSPNHCENDSGCIYSTADLSLFINTEVLDVSDAGLIAQGYPATVTSSGRDLLTTFFYRQLSFGGTGSPESNRVYGFIGRQGFQDDTVLTVGSIDGGGRVWAVHDGDIANVDSNAPTIDISIRVAAYNVKFGDLATPEEIAALFVDFQPDLIAFCEVPAGDWTERAGQVLGMDYHYVGHISSANHVDKFKSVLSRTPLTRTQDLNLALGQSWNPASAVRVETEIQGVPFALYSLHIAGSGATNGHAYEFVNEVLIGETAKRYMLACDFNNIVGSPGLDNFENAGLRPVWRDLAINLASSTTIVGGSSNSVIDHILYNERSGANATTGGIINSSSPPLSDHHAVYAEIVFPVAVISTGENVPVAGWTLALCGWTLVAIGLVVRRKKKTEYS